MTNQVAPEPEPESRVYSNLTGGSFFYRPNNSGRGGVRF